MPLGRGRALLALVAAAALSACASSSKIAEEPQAAPPQYATAPAAVPAEPPRDATASPQVEPARAEVAAQRKPVTVRPGVVLSAGARAASLPSATPRQLVGLAQSDVQDLFGQPFLLKREGGAELWQYRAPNCVLDVFLYAGKDGTQHVTHAELRARRENARPPAGCYAQILHAPRPQPQQTARG